MPQRSFEHIATIPDSTFIDPQAEELIVDPSGVALITRGVTEQGFTYISPLHGRSIIDPNHYVFRDQPVYDEFGNYYAQYSIKGSDSTFPYAKYEKIQPNKVRVHGMLESTTFERCQQTSHYLRSQGVLVEWPIFHAEPESFAPQQSSFVPDSGYSLDQLREFLYDDYILTQSSVRERYPFTNDSLRRAEQVFSALEEMKFSVMYRASLSNARVGDLGYIHNAVIRSRLVSEAITALQTRKIDDFAVWSDLKELNSLNPNDQRNYLTNILPRLMGENLARLHDAQCVHSYLHSGNWSLAGEIVDLDTVESATQFEPDIPSVGPELRLRDFLWSLNSVHSIARDLHCDEREIGLRFFEGYYNKWYDSKVASTEDHQLLEGIMGTADFSSYPDIPMIVTLPNELIELIQDKTIRQARAKLEPNSTDVLLNYHMADALTSITEEHDLEIKKQVKKFVDEVLHNANPLERTQYVNSIVSRQKLKLIKAMLCEIFTVLEYQSTDEESILAKV